MNQVARPTARRMSVSEFLAWPGDGTDRKFELVDGELREVSPASRVHAAIQSNLIFMLVGATRTRQSPAQVLTEGAVVVRPDNRGTVRVPDVALVPADDKPGDQAADNPILMVEVLSPSNVKDTRGKVSEYFSLPSVSEVVLVHSDRMRVEVHRRDAAPAVAGPGERLVLAAAGLDCAVEDVYASTFLSR